MSVHTQILLFSELCVICHHLYLLVCLEDFVLFFGVNEIDFSLFRGLMDSLTRMILWGVGGDWVTLVLTGDDSVGVASLFRSPPFKLPVSDMFNSF